jgi:hypothetical protein
MKYILSVLFLFIFFSAFSQVYQEMPQYGYRANRFAFDSTLQIPTTCGVPTIKSVVSVNKKSAIAFDSCNNRLYYYNPSTLTWQNVTGASGFDSTSLSNRINLKIDSLKRSNDSIYAYKNGIRYYQFKDSVGSFIPYTGATSNVDLGLKNISANAFFNGFSVMYAAGTTNTLTIDSTPVHLVNGSGGQTFKLPSANTLKNGTIFSFNNNQTSGAILVINNSNTLVKSVPSGAYMTLELIDNSVAAGTWDAHFQTPSNVSWSTNTLDYAGSITNATWNGNIVAYNRGGTGSSSAFNQGGIVYGSSTSTLGTNSAGTSGQLLVSNGTSAPTWSTINAITDTTNKFVNAVTKITDSSIRVFKGSTSTDILIRGNPQQATGSNGLSGTSTITLGGNLNNGVTAIESTTDALSSMTIGNTRKLDAFVIRNNQTTINSGSDIFLIQPTSGTDTTTYKPLGVASNGKISRINNWFGGSSATGSVTSVATGYGLSGGTITTTGTLIVDSATLSSKYLRRNDTSNLVATKSNLALKLNITDTSNKFVNDVTKITDSTIRVFKGNTITDLKILGKPIDTLNKFVNSVTKINDSTIRVFKGSTSTDLLIRGNATGSGTTPSLQDVATIGNFYANDYSDTLKINAYDGNIKHPILWTNDLNGGQPDNILDFSYNSGANKNIAKIKFGQVNTSIGMGYIELTDENSVYKNELCSRTIYQNSYSPSGITQTTYFPLMKNGTDTLATLDNIRNLKLCNTYSASISASGTNAPTLDYEFINELVSVGFDYSSSNYIITCAGCFPLNKTYVAKPSLKGAITANAYVHDIDNIYIELINSSGTQVTTGFGNMLIEIKVYN